MQLKELLIGNKSSSRQFYATVVWIEKNGISFIKKC